MTWESSCAATVHVLKFFQKSDPRRCVLELLVVLDFRTDQLAPVRELCVGGAGRVVVSLLSPWDDGRVGLPLPRSSIRRIGPAVSLG